MNINSYKNKLDLLSEYFPNLDKNEIFEKFCEELSETGSNVRRDCKKYGVTKHVFNDEMIKLYENSSSFIFELLVGASKKEKIKRDNYIKKYLVRSLKPKLNNILCYGDGIGIDSIIFSNMGFQTTYFDVDGITSNFAKFLFNKNRLSKKIKIIHDEDLLLENSFNVIICREVLEHLNDPQEAIKNMWEILKPNGICIISESFASVTPQFPTHLRSNLKFSKKSVKLIIDEGFELIDRYNNSNLYIFKKTDKNNQNRFSTIPLNRRRDRIKKIIRDKIIFYLS